MWTITLLEESCAPKSSSPEFWKQPDYHGDDLFLVLELDSPLSRWIVSTLESHIGSQWCEGTQELKALASTLQSSFFVITKEAKTLPFNFYSEQNFADLFKENITFPTRMLMRQEQSNNYYETSTSTIWILQRYKDKRLWMHVLLSKLEKQIMKSENINKYLETLELGPTSLSFVFWV